MKIVDRASDFKVLLLSQSVELTTKLQSKLVNSKYDVSFYTDALTMLEKLKQDPAHIVIIDLVSLTQNLTNFMQSILDVSTEIRFILLSPVDKVLSLQGYYQFNVDLVQDRDHPNFDESVWSAVNLVCENLFRVYQNEQVYSAYLDYKAQYENILQTLEFERRSPKVKPYQSRIAQYKTAQSKEELLGVFYQNTPEQSWIYLKFIGSIHTLVAVSYYQVPENWVEGFSFKVVDKQNFLDQVIVGELPEEFLNYARNKFSKETIKFLPLIIKNELEGILITAQDISSEVAEDFSLMTLAYTNIVYESQPKFLDVEDSLTGFYNQLFYKRILDKELDRAKRTLSPVSIIKVSIDKFSEIEVAQGHQVMDSIIVKVAELIKDTSRLPDYACRTDENEFTLVLVNCDRKGAAIRAERLRVALNSAQLLKSGVQITISQGISEYPSLVSTKSELDNSASRARNFSSEKGGDRICIYKAQTQHQPDFVVTHV